ncbi:MAG: sensor domain-containing diguanylate cyclase [Candidatus Omnitrophica bacterium]|nr:sensor domain-containing diguanylate cyclase [Candidatus Omnitrophota bacterium]
MIRIQKRLSYNLDQLLTRQERIPLQKRIIFYLAAIMIFYILIPVFVGLHIRPIPVFSLLLFYLLNFIAAIILINSNFQRRYRLEIENQDLHEKINLLTEEMVKQRKQRQILMGKSSRYNSLKDIIEQINQNFSLEKICEQLCCLVFELISGGRGLCVLYLVDERSQRLKVFTAKKEDEELVIKAKEGDIFDFWVLRHTSPLIVEDARKDFRFDPEKLKSQAVRPVLSLISAPFVSENRLLGILRLDSQHPNFYTQDDLRFLATICELGAVAIENGELFQKTQDLAIHDGLTRLYVKGYFMERLKEECARAMRDNTDLSLLMLDIDFFKDYNDKFGHTAGDLVLIRLARVLEDQLKQYDPIISRFGGEEFCIILPRCDSARALQIAEDIRLKVEKNKITLRRQETQITASLGVASFPVNAAEENELILQADKALYEAKQKGRNKVIGV